MKSKSITEKSFKYIFDVVNYLPISTEWNKLKSRYVSQYNKNEGNICKEFERSLTYCPSCFTAFNQNTKIVKVVPETKRRFVRRLLKKAETNKPLTKYQTKYLKKTDKHVGNKLVIKCTVCKKKITKNLKKPKKEVIKKEENIQNVTKSKKKKKKKKDRFSGLNQEAVLSLANDERLQENKEQCLTINEKTNCKQTTEKSKTKGVTHSLTVVDRQNLEPNKAMTFKSKLQTRIIEKKKEVALIRKKEARTNKILAKFNTALSKKTSSKSNSDLSKFLSTL